MSSIWNAFTSGNKPPQQQQQQQQQQHIPSHEPTHLSFDPTEGQGVESFLQSSAFADPSQLHPLAGLNRDTLEYIELGDSPALDGNRSLIPSRDVSDDLCYGTGTLYLSGLTVGGAWGLQEGLRGSVGQPPRLRLNAVLNAVTRRGPFLGNSLGVVTIIYTGFNWSLARLRGKHDAANSIVAGGLSGMLFKSTRGLRPMMISGGIVASLAGAWTIGRGVFFPAPTVDQPAEASSELNL
ncbi:Tim17/Tim22/Tim23/Pmp24 family-domain-containing protein [Mariannaea sp. PMI_226]|nr:Tim17/Tim22/Tim23/Pmp24 family-domain-containing protein [Mariannaea sp. PMI_226]